MRLIDFDLDAAADAFAAGDDARFATTTAALGITVDVASLSRLTVSYSANRRRLGKLALAAVYRAMSDDDGVALERDDGGTADRYLAAAVRLDDRLVLGVSAYSQANRNGWSSIKRWYKDTSRNREIMVAWASASDVHRIEIGIARRAALAPVGDDRGAELLAAILASPHDDAPRLVYADWLLERGDPRGELIQLECRLASDPGDAAIRTRAVQVRALCHAAFDKLVDGAPYVTRRGFIDEVTLTVGVLVRRVEALIAAQPIHRIVVPIENHTHLVRLAELELPPQIAIRLSGDDRYGTRIDIDEAASIFAGRADLDLANFDAAPERWNALVAACPATRRFRLSACRGISPTLFAPLAELPVLESVELLGMRWFEVDPTPSLLRALDALGARVSRIGGLVWREAAAFRTAYRALLSSSNLVELHNPQTSYGDILAELLAASPSSRSLRKLAIATKLPATIRALLASPHLADLAELQLWPNPEHEVIPELVALLDELGRPGLAVRWPRELVRK